ncbi:hypothetical protein BJX65DRAFT_190327 [Aspergillus insuetus]
MTLPAEASRGDMGELSTSCVIKSSFGTRQDKKDSPWAGKVVDIGEFPSFSLLLLVVLQLSQFTTTGDIRPPPPTYLLRHELACYLRLLQDLPQACRSPSLPPNPVQRITVRERQDEILASAFLPKLPYQGRFSGLGRRKTEAKSGSLSFRRTGSQSSVCLQRHTPHLHALRRERGLSQNSLNWTLRRFQLGQRISLISIITSGVTEM